MYLILFLILFDLCVSGLLFRYRSRACIYVFSLNLVLLSALLFYFMLVVFKFDIFIIYAILISFVGIVIFVIFYLLWNSKRLVSKEGNRLTNLLSLGLGLTLSIMVVSFPVAFLVDKKIASYMFVTYLLVVIICLYFMMVFVSCLILSFSYMKLQEDKEVGAIIVLGSGLINDKVPPLLGNRIDTGYDFYHNYKHDNKIVFIMSGGQGVDESLPESEAMKQYLVDKGIAKHLILCEKVSTTTYENLMYSKKLIEDVGVANHRVVICTNNFHMLRAIFLARNVGFKNFSVLGSKTIGYFFTNAFIREIIGILRMDWWLQIIFSIIVLTWYIFTMISL